MMRIIYQIKLGNEETQDMFRRLYKDRDVENRKPKNTTRVDKFNECFLGNSIYNTIVKVNTEKCKFAVFNIAN